MLVGVLATAALLSSSGPALAVPATTARAVIATPAPSPGGGLVKVYVVKTPEENGGTPDSLANIAARTLGDANRSGEIFELNRGRAQQDGSSLQDPAQLQPGWILRLPPEAGGPDVRLARETVDAGTRAPTDGAASAPPAGEPATPTGDAIVLPLPAVLAVFGALLLGLLTVGIMARRRMRRAFAWAPRLIRRLGEPIRRARRLAFRKSLAQAFAADGESLRLAYRVVTELSGPKGRAVHAVSIDDTGVTAWVATQDDPPAPWQDLGESRWRLPADALARPVRAVTPAQGVPTPFLVRVGVDDQGGKVFVDLSRLDGVLSVAGDPDVAKDVVEGLLAEVARAGSGIPAAVLSRPEVEVALPQGMPRIQVPRAAEAVADPQAGTLRAAARRRFVRALLVVPEPPSAGEAAELAALCDETTGRIGLVRGDADGAHWRWRATRDGSVQIPPLRLTVSAPTAPVPA
ncbi:LysM peptidoglycan-binding domain-containing protein [Nonomuraea wenchangensis]|uniref:LysM peptidoglycan-binding domain-containing protein n=1 Tax=Nonomuraea wenchangensis TaxID=568860 RepID=UPI003412BD18